MAARDYTIVIRGEFGRRHRMAFDDLGVSISSGLTRLSGRLLDQAAFYGVLRRLESLGLEITEIRSTVPGPEPHSSGNGAPSGSNGDELA